MERKSKHPQLSIGSDVLWVLIILAGFIFLTSLVPLHPNDYWWHLRIGQVIFTEHTFPDTNKYAWTVPEDQPFFYAAWLGELLLYILHRLGGIEMTTFMRTFLAGTTFWLVGIEARRTSGSWRIAALVLALACLMSTNNLIVRPQMWAWLPFIIIYSCLRRYTSGQTKITYLFLCFFVMIFWVNLHGSFIVGLGLMGINLLGEAIRYRLNLNGKLNKKQLVWLAASTGATLLAILINPHSTGIFSYLKELLTNRPVQQFIEEWQSPTPEGWANSIFYISILIMLITLSLSKVRLTPSELILTLAFLWLAWEGQRSVIWYGMAVMPLLGKLISGISMRMPVLPVQRNLFNLLLAVILLTPVLSVQPWFIDRFPLPDIYRAQVINDPEIGPLLSIHTPINAARFLANHPYGRIYNELGYGSYFIWAIPELKVFIDPRIELYPQEIWDDYIDISNGTRSNELLQKYDVETVILDRKIQAELSLALSSDRVWQRVYHDPNTEIWQRTSDH